VFTSSIGYAGGPGSGTAMPVVGLLVLAQWRASNGSVMALKLQHDRFQSAGAGIWCMKTKDTVIEALVPTTDSLLC